MSWDMSPETNLFWEPKEDVHIALHGEFIFRYEIAEPSFSCENSKENSKLVI